MFSLKASKLFLPRQNVVVKDLHHFMDFPPTWIVLMAEDYELATPRIEGELTAEVMAGRILDHLKIVDGDSKQLDIDIDFLIPMA